MNELRSVQRPESIGRYRVVGDLAAGGMAEVFLARTSGPEGIDPPVALKRILPHLAREERFVKMFLDEARILARIRHPNVVHVFELGRHDGELFLAMEYLEGETFASLARTLLATNRRLPPELCAHLVAEACAGLHATHECVDEDGRALGVVHRDVSPQNLMVTYDGHVKVLDFGIAHAVDRMVKTEIGEVKGKLEYMAPEQCRGEPLDRRSDVFSLGVVLYELSLLRRLFKRPTRLDTMRALCDDFIVPPARLDPAYPRPLERVVMRALARRREDRHATASEMRRDLLRVIGAREEAPEEAMAALMRELFADRIAKKREMLKQVREGAPIADIVPAEAHAETELPESMPARSATPARGRRSAAAIGVFAFVALAAAGYLFIRRPASPSAGGVAPSATSATIASSASSALTAQPSPASNVVVQIASVPAGATVLVDGRARGKTPLSLELPRSTDAVEVVLEHATAGTASQRVVPDVDQRVVLSLHKRPAPRTPRSTPQPSDSTKPFTRFE